MREIGGRGGGWKGRKEIKINIQSAHQISQVVHSKSESKQSSISIMLINVLLVGEPDQVSL